MRLSLEYTFAQAVTMTTTVVYCFVLLSVVITLMCLSLEYTFAQAITMTTMEGPVMLGESLINVTFGLAMQNFTDEKNRIDL